MSRRLQASLLLSTIVHLGFFALAGSWVRHTLVDGGRVLHAGSVMMVECVDSTGPAPDPAPLPAAPREESPTITDEIPSVKEESPTANKAVASEVPSTKPGTPGGDPAGTAAPGKRLNVDFARMAWIRGVFARTLTYQRNAPKGFEGMVRSALPPHPSSADGKAKVSLKFDRSGTVSGVDIRSDSPGLKTALARVGWKEGPLPTRYQIPCSGLNVNVTVAGPKLIVGVEIL